VDEERTYADVKITLGMVFLCLLILGILACSVANRSDKFSRDGGAIDVFVTQNEM
jgi:hypothetical protein